MVGGLVEDEQVGFLAEHVGQRHALELSAGEVADGLVVVGDAQLGQVLLYALRLLLAVPEAGLHDGHVLRIGRCLLEVCHPQVPSEDDASALGLFLAGNNVEHGGLSGAVAGNESDALALGDAETDIVEKFLVADGKREVLYLKIGVHNCHNRYFWCKSIEKMREKFAECQKKRTFALEFMTEYSLEWVSVCSFHHSIPFNRLFTKVPL